MTMPRENRDAAITILQRIRSKVLDTEKRLLIDDLDQYHLTVRASQIQGQAELLAIAALDETPRIRRNKA